MRKIFFTAGLLWLANPLSALAADAALDLDRQIADAERMVQSAPKDWSAHAKLSYLQWQGGNVTDAVSEGQRAVYAAPGNPLPLVNLAHIYQGLGEFDSAIPLYEKARKLAPNDWVPWVSLARCWFGKDQMAPGLAILREMAAKASDDFAWNYQLGVSLDTVGQNDLAVKPLERAVSVAPTGEQRSAALGELMVASIGAGKLDVAQVYLDKFAVAGCVEGEPYVVAASAFPNATIFDTANKTLTDSRYHEIFFRLGRVFQAASKNDLAEKSFARAIEMNPGVGAYHVALATVLEQRGKQDEAIAELEQATMFDPADFAAKLLLERRGKKLLIVNFHAEGVSCGCQTTRMEAGFRAQPGVALVSMERKAPYRGMLVIDPSEVTLDKVFAACTASTFPAGGESVPVGFHYVADGTVDVNTIRDTVRITHAELYGKPTVFARKFDPIQPTLAGTGNNAL